MERSGDSQADATDALLLQEGRRSFNVCHRS
jgi:hypothetical protein